MITILVVDDDRNTAKLMKTILSHADFEAVIAYNAKEAYDVLDTHKVDLILLDVMLPGIDGYKFTESLRETENNIPILMVTAKQLPKDTIKGFLAGTDDYMTKPVNEEELILRIKALLRRAKISGEKQLTVGSLLFDYNSLSVIKDGVAYTLPKKEFYLIYKLLSYPNKIFTRLQLMDEIWGMDSDTVEKTIDVHINRLRKHFENINEFEIIAVRGVGYKAVIKV